jgi:DNA-binding NtrC family response regulator
LSATHRDLAEEVRHKRFRLDLLFRLGVLPLEIPPLSARLDDLPILVRRFLEELGVDTALTPEAQHRLRQHAWPGNVRELRNVLQRAVLCSKSRVIDAEHLIFGPASFDVGNASAGSLDARMDEAILLELQRQGGHRRRTYEALRMPRSTFYRWLRRHRQRLEGVAVPWGGGEYALRDGMP